MRARQHVEHNLKGGTNTVQKLDNSNLTTFDTDKFEYRTINLATVSAIKYKDELYEVV